MLALGAIAAHNRRSPLRSWNANSATRMGWTKVFFCVCGSHPRRPVKPRAQIFEQELPLTERPGLLAVQMSYLPTLQLMQECGREVHFEIGGPEIPYSALHYVANAFVIASR
jgi:hypothetical protein